MSDYTDENLKEIYLQELIDNYKNPKNFGKLDDFDYFAHKKNRSCGDEFDLFLKFDDKNKVSKVAFNGQGCAISTASFSIFTEYIKGLTLDELKKLSEDDIFEMLKIEISSGKVNCAILPLGALKKALKIEDE